MKFMLQRLKEIIRAYYGLEVLMAFIIWMKTKTNFLWILMNPDPDLFHRRKSFLVPFSEFPHPGFRRGDGFLEGRHT